MVKQVEKKQTATIPREVLIRLAPEERLKIIGHRGYVGGTTPGLWFGMGRRQFHYLVSVGLRPSHRFLDVACGALRLGQFLIPFLDEGNYLGVEGEKALVDAGLKHELLYKLDQLKRPRFAYNYDFDVSSLGQFDYAIAQSLFTHLNQEDIHKCFSGLAPFAAGGAKFFVTYYEGEHFAKQDKEIESNAQLGWRYPFEELSQIAARSGWLLTRIGAWGHPRNQMMSVATRSSS